MPLFTFLLLLKTTLLKERLSLCFVYCDYLRVSYSDNNTCYLNCDGEKARAEFSVNSLYDNKELKLVAGSDSVDVRLPWSYRNRKFNRALKTLAPSPNRVTVGARVEHSEDETVDTNSKLLTTQFDTYGNRIVLNRFHFAALNDLHTRYLSADTSQNFSGKSSDSTAGLFFAVSGEVKGKVSGLFGVDNWEDAAYYFRVFPANGLYEGSVSLLVLNESDDKVDYSFHVLSDERCGKEFAQTSTTELERNFQTTKDTWMPAPEEVLQAAKNGQGHCRDLRDCQDLFSVSANKKVCLVLVNKNIFSTLRAAVVFQLVRKYTLDRKELVALYQKMAPWFGPNTADTLMVVGIVGLVVVVLVVLFIIKSAS